MNGVEARRPARISEDAAWHDFRRVLVALIVGPDVVGLADLRAVDRREQPVDGLGPQRLVVLGEDLVEDRDEAQRRAERDRVPADGADDAPGPREAGGLIVVPGGMRVRGPNPGKEHARDAAPGRLEESHEPELVPVHGPTLLRAWDSLGSANISQRGHPWPHSPPAGWPMRTRKVRVMSWRSATRRSARDESPTMGWSSGTIRASASSGGPPQRSSSAE